jgi:hypothetical protein
VVEIDVVAEEDIVVVGVDDTVLDGDETSTIHMLLPNGER